MPMPYAPRKYRESLPVNVWPARHLSKAIRQERKDTGKPLTRIIDECLAARYGLPLVDGEKLSTQYPSHKPQAHLLNERG